MMKIFCTATNMLHEADASDCEWIVKAHQTWLRGTGFGDETFYDIYWCLLMAGF